MNKYFLALSAYNNSTKAWKNSVFTLSSLHVLHSGASLSKLVPVQVKVEDPSIRKPEEQDTVMTWPDVAG